MLKREHVIGSTKVCHNTGLCGVIEVLDWPKFRIIWSNGETGHYRLGDCPLENIQRIAEDSSHDVRDDAEFRARIARLADAGLTLDCTPKPYTPPFYGKGLTILIIPPMPKRSKASEFITGLVWWLPFIVVGLALITGLKGCNV